MTGGRPGRALLFALLLSAAGVAPGGAAAPENSLTRRESLVVDPSRLRGASEGVAARLSLPGGVSAGCPGDAALPALPVTLALPEGMAPGAVRVTVIATHPLPRVTGVAALLDPAAVARSGLPATLTPGTLPEHPVVQVGVPGYRCGARVATLLVTPFRTGPDGGLELVTRLDLDIDLVPEGPGGAGRAVSHPPVDPIDRFRPLRRAPERIDGGAPFAPTFRPSLDGSAVACVILTDEVQAPVYQQLADWKTRIGIPTVVRTVGWVRANYPNGVDTPETLRAFIRDAATHWGTQSIVLGGDTPVVPIRYAHSRYYTTEDIPTDLYYQCLDGSWNADGDDLFGEAYASPTDPGDDCDLYADVRIGRLPTRTAAEAQVVVDKLVRYAASPVRDGRLTQILALGEVLFPADFDPGDVIQLDGAEICETALAARPPEWGAVRLYENCPDPGYPGCVFETKAVVLDSLNSGFGIVHHVGHGFTNTMSVGHQGQTLANADAAALVNGDRTFLLYAINCTSSAVDYSCIAEEFLRNPNGGAVASIGSTRFDFPFTSWNFQDEFYRVLFAEPGAAIGQVVDDARLPFVPQSFFDTSARWTQFSQILLGDPDIPIWTLEPADLTVTAPATPALGDDLIPVSVQRGGNPVEGARICLEKPGDAYAVVLTDATGTALVPFRPKTAGPFAISVTATNAVPWGDSGLVVPGTAPHLVPGAVDLIDDGTDGSFGNGDGRADAGETIALRIALENAGGATPDSVLLTLSTFAPGIQLLDSNARYAPVDSGGVAAPLDPVLVRLAATIPDRTEAPLTLMLQSDTLTSTDALRLSIHAPVLEWWHAWARDSVGIGNDDGLFAPGEPIALRGVLRNLGLGASDSLVITLTSADSTITISDSVMVVGTLPGGDATPRVPEDGFVCTLSDTTGLAAGARRLEARAFDRNGGPVIRATFPVAPPGRLPAPGALTATGEPGGVLLTFTPVPRARGYRVFRSNAPAGPFVRINPDLLSNSALYRDEGITPFVVFSYVVAAQDSFGNEGALSGVASASSTLPARTGFPLAMQAAANGSVTLADLDGLPGLEVIGAGEEIYAARADGTELSDGDADPATVGALTGVAAGPFWNAPAVGDVDHDGAPEIAAVSWTGSLYLFGADGQVRPGFPRNLNLLNLASPNPLGSVAMDDLDGDLDLELVVFVGANIFAFHHTGAELLDGDANPATIGLFKSTSTGFSYGTPALADLTGDGLPEIICGMRDGRVHVFQATTSAVELPGFPVITGGNITSSPAIGDLDDDGQPEIVVGSSVGQMIVLRGDGTPLPGWPQSIQLQQDLDSSPALGDLTGDGLPDVVCGASNGRLFAWRGDGVPLPGFPVIILDRLGQPAPLRSSPVLADIDSDGLPEILIADQIGRLHAFRANGSPVAGFPVVTENKIDGAPAVWDLDGDGLTEIVVQSFDQQIHVWDTPWTFNPGATPWPMFHHDERHTGDLNQGLGAVAARSPDPVAPVPAVSLEDPAPNPFRGETRVGFLVGPGIPKGGAAALPGAGGAGSVLRPVRLEVFTPAGRAVRLLVRAALAPGRYEAGWDGRGNDGRSVAAGVYFVRLSTPEGSVARKLVRVSR